MIQLEKLRDSDIESEVLADLENRSKKEVEDLLKFYYNIVVDMNTKYKSFRYKYSKVAITTICNSTNDTETLSNFKVFDEQKKANDKRNPVKERKQGKSTTTTKRQASKPKSSRVNVSFGKI